MIKDNMAQKLHSWFGKDCEYHIIKENNNCIMVWVHSDEAYSLARLIQIGDKVEISVDMQVDKIDYDIAGTLMRRCVELI